MKTLLVEAVTAHSPESLVEAMGAIPGVMLLQSALRDTRQGRYSFVVAQPFLTFKSVGPHCEIATSSAVQELYGNPLRVLDGLMARYELPDEADVPFPLGGCFGYWAYDLRHFVEPRLRRRAEVDLDLPDCQAGFYDSLVAFDHQLAKTWIIATGWLPDGSRCIRRATAQVVFWRDVLSRPRAEHSLPTIHRATVATGLLSDRVRTSLTRREYVERVERAQRYIRTGDIYQVNLAQRLEYLAQVQGWELYRRLAAVSPAPFSAFYAGGTFELVSSSPELFLRMSGRQIQTRPIKGTRPRSSEPTRDAQLSYELVTSPKEMAELVMITDLMRNDLGRVCEYGTVRVPELVRLERYAHVQHLVSTIEGRLRTEVSHLAALAACFPGGSITGAPKVRAMEIIDELEPVARGPYTGCLGYLGFNRESQLSILIRSAICTPGRTLYYAGSGIVADSDSEAEYEESLVKARGWLEVMQSISRSGGSIEAGRPERAPGLATTPSSDRMLP